MTKKEEKAIEGIRHRAALNLPPFEKPAPLTESYFGEPMMRERKAVWFQNSYNNRVSLGWSDGFSHNRECPVLPADSQNGYLSASQGMETCYATRMDALKAMRWEKTEEVMRELARIDAMILAEEAAIKRATGEE